MAKTTDKSIILINVICFIVLFIIIILLLYGTCFVIDNYRKIVGRLLNTNVTLVRRWIDICRNASSIFTFVVDIALAKKLTLNGILDSFKKSLLPTVTFTVTTVPI